MKQLLPTDVKMFAVVKANAYGHGDYEVARAAIDAGADYLAVAFLDEALSLRNRGITEPILVLGAARPEDAGVAAKNGVALTVYHDEWLDVAKSFIPNGAILHVHVKCDTGMGRLGVRSGEELRDLEARLVVEPKFQFAGIYTHFATADEVNLSYYEEQLFQFKKMLSYLDELPELVHAANSAAALRFEEPIFNAIRFGISMYGLSPSPEIASLLPFKLQPAFSLKTKIVHVKKLTKGDFVSYGATYEVKNEEWIATLPIGYADGWIRKLSGLEVMVGEDRAPIVGRICMDQCMIKLNAPSPVGTVVTLIGESITADDIAEKLETINYEVVCMITSRVPRVYLKNDEIVNICNPLL